MIIIPDCTKNKESNFFMILSPNREPISLQKFHDKETMLEAAQLWQKQFLEHGFYSFRKGVIPYEFLLRELIVVEYEEDGEEYGDFEFYWLLPEDEQYPYFEDSQIRN